MRSAGVILNDLADRRIDRQVARTRTRPLASGELTVPQALAALGALLAAAAGLLSLLPPLARWLSLIAVALAAAYPLAKRILPIPQAVLGIAFGWGGIMAWAAVREQLDLSAWIVFLSTVCWAVAYDTIYALQDRDDDRRIGVKSSALFFRDHTWIAVGICEMGLVIGLTLVGWRTGAGQGLYAGLLGTGVFLAWQAWRVRSIREGQEAFRLFAQHVWVGGILLAGIALGFV
ncbi:4-hydroxybenzoate octaprenyltransferase [Nitrospira sp.]|nr:4-hydroxybenzoate octaprenyltransferase [Nitrospira sp.]